MCQVNGSVEQSNTLVFQWIRQACGELRAAYGRNSTKDEVLEIELCHVLATSSADQGVRIRGAHKLRVLVKEFASCYRNMRL